MKVLRSVRISVTVCRLLLYWILYFVSGFIPRNKNIILYGCAYGFSNNSKYAFLFALSNKTDKQRIYWVTSLEEDFIFLNKNNLPVLKKKSFKALWYCLIAKYYYFSWFTDDINFWTSRNAVLTSFWHGLPMKKIQYDIHSGYLGSIFNPCNTKEKLTRLFNIIVRPAFFQSPTFLYCPDKNFAKCFQSAFKIKEEQLIYDEYPRVKYLLSDCKINFFDDLDINFPLNKKKIIYIPTFRDFDKDWFQHVFTESAISELNSFLKKKNIVFYIKGHPNDDIKFAEKYENIVNIATKSDIYTLFKKVKFDLYLTDYSSVFFEMIKISDNVELFWPDYNEYLAYSRECYFELHTAIKKSPIYSFDSLLEYIDKSF